MLSGILKAFAVLIILAVAIPAVLLFLIPLRFASATTAHGRLGTEEICAELLRGDYTAASSRIARKAEKREFRLLDSIVWLGGRGGSPFSRVAPSQLFTDLPKGPGKPAGCSPQAWHNLSGLEISTEINLEYPAHYVRVGMWYSFFLLFPRLQYIQIYPPEPRARSARP